MAPVASLTRARHVYAVKTGRPGTEELSRGQNKVRSVAAQMMDNITPTWQKGSSDGAVNIAGNLIQGFAFLLIVRGSLLAATFATKRRRMLRGVVSRMRARARAAGPQHLRPVHRLSQDRGPLSCPGGAVEAERRTRVWRLGR